MRRGERFPHDSAELVLSDVVVEQLADLTKAEQLDVVVELVRLCEDPAGKHPLHAPLAGWNTVEVLAGRKRCVYRASVVDGVGVIDVLCLGPRTDSEVYDMATALRDAGILTEGELTDLWEALAILDLIAEQVGLDGWDYSPEPAEAILARRRDDRCGLLLPRAQRPCIRREGHPGPHRAR